MHDVLSSSVSFEPWKPGYPRYVQTQIIRQIIKQRLSGGVGGSHGSLACPLHSSMPAKTWSNSLRYSLVYLATRVYHTWSQTYGVPWTLVAKFEKCLCQAPRPGPREGEKKQKKQHRMGNALLQSGDSNDCFFDWQIWIREHRASTVHVVFFGLFFSLEVCSDVSLFSNKFI